MRIGDAAAAAGTTPRALRFYEQQGLLPPPRRSATGQRGYRPEEVARIRVIRDLLSLGLTVADLRACADRLALLDDETLPAYAVPGSACSRPSGIAERRLATLNAEIARLTDLRNRLAAQLTGSTRPPEAADHRLPAN